MSFPNIPPAFPAYPPDATGSSWVETALRIDFPVPEQAAVGLLPEGSDLRPILFGRPPRREALVMMSAYFAELVWEIDLGRRPGKLIVPEYREAGMLVPCCVARSTPVNTGVFDVEARTKRLRRGVFCPLMYLDSPDAVTVGRETLGFPKKFATILLTMHRGAVHDAEVLFRGGPVMSVTTSGSPEPYRPRASRPGSPSWLGSREVSAWWTLPWWVVKVMPDTYGAGSQVHELVEVAWVSAPPTRVRIVAAELLLADGTQHSPSSDNLLGLWSNAVLQGISPPPRERKEAHPSIASGTRDELAARSRLKVVEHRK